MIDELKKFAHEHMEKSMGHLQQQLGKLRTGRANPSLLDGITVDYYGTQTPLKQVGQISTPEARLIQIQPFDKSIIGLIEKAIITSNLGVTPSNDGNLVRIPFPALTEEKRKDIVRDIKKIGEEARIQVRNHRRDANEKIKKAEKDKALSEDDSKKFQEEIQKITDIYTKKVDDILTAKEKEVLTV